MAGDSTKAQRRVERTVNRMTCSVLISAGFPPAFLPEVAQSGKNQPQSGDEDACYNRYLGSNRPSHEDCIGSYDRVKWVANQMKNEIADNRDYPENENHKQEEDTPDSKDKLYRVFAQSVEEPTDMEERWRRGKFHEWIFDSYFSRTVSTISPTKKIMSMAVNMGETMRDPS